MFVFKRYYICVCVHFIYQIYIITSHRYRSSKVTLLLVLASLKLQLLATFVS
jgi:hypothetical protein